MGAYENWQELKKLLRISLDESIDNNDGADEHYMMILNAMDSMELEQKKEMINTIYIGYREVFDAYPIDSLIEEVIEKIPLDLKIHADRWGWDDTEVRDLVCEWMHDELKG